MAWTPPSDVVDGLGRSGPTNERNVGAAADPDIGPAHTKLADCVCNVPVSVPLTVTGEPVTAKMALGRESPTLVTVPPAAGLDQEV